MMIKTRKIMSIFITFFLTVLCLLSIHIFMPAVAQINSINPLEIASQRDLLNNNILAQETSDIEQSDLNKKEESPAQESSYPVKLEGETLFEFRASIDGLSNEQRAKTATDRIKKLADDNSILVEDLNITKVEGIHLIQVDDNLLFALIQADAKAENKPIDELAQEYLEKVKNAIIEYREKRTFYQFGLRALLIFLSTLIVILIFKFLNWFFPSYKPSNY
jgi:hypothetical protein